MEPEAPGRRLDLLREGSVELLGRMPRSSNATFLVRVSRGEQSARAIYKPVAGERPLSDFEPGLYRRECAAYLLSEHLGWGFVPPTVVRDDAPLGAGSLQWFVDCDFREHYFTLHADAPETHRRLAQIAAFDLIANNTDRKSGHVLRGDDGRVWGIDHGLCFSEVFKLRTVIWDFAGDPVPAELLADIAAVAGDVPEDMSALLDPAEVSALQRRAERLFREGVLPHDPSGMRYPWPLV